MAELEQVYVGSWGSIYDTVSVVFYSLIVKASYRKLFSSTVRNGTPTSMGCTFHGYSWHPDLCRCLCGLHLGMDWHNVSWSAQAACDGGGYGLWLSAVLWDAGPLKQLKTLQWPTGFTFHVSIWLATISSSATDFFGSVDVYSVWHSIY